MLSSVPIYISTSPFVVDVQINKVVVEMALSLFDSHTFLAGCSSFKNFSCYDSEYECQIGNQRVNLIYPYYSLIGTNATIDLFLGLTECAYGGQNTSISYMTQCQNGNKNYSGSIGLGIDNDNL